MQGVSSWSPSPSFEAEFDCSSVPAHFDLRSWNKKKEQEGKQFWRLSHSLLKLSSFRVRWFGARSNIIIFGRIRMFFLPNRIFLIRTLSSGFAATLWFRGTTQTDSREVQVKGSRFFCNSLLVNSSMAKSTLPLWLHFPFPCKPRPAGKCRRLVKHHT